MTLPLIRAHCYRRKHGPRSAIIDAAARLLREQGAAALTTRAVAEAAGVQPPTLYRLFGDKDGLIDAVAEHVMATYVAAKSEPIDPDPVTDLRAAWRMHDDYGLATHELYTLLNRRGPQLAGDRRGDRGAPRPCPAAGDGGRAQSERGARPGADPRRQGSGTVLALLSTPPEQRDPGLADAMLEAVLAAIPARTPLPRHPQARPRSRSSSPHSSTSCPRSAKPNARCSANGSPARSRR